MLSFLVSKGVSRWIPFLEVGLVKCRCALGGGWYVPSVIFRSSSFWTLDVFGRRTLHFLHLNPLPLPIDSHRVPQLEQEGFSTRIVSTSPVTSSFSTFKVNTPRGRGWIPPEAVTQSPGTS